MAQFLRLLRRKFIPTDIAGLSVWLDAQDYASFALSGGSISQWNDKSGKNNHAIQGTGANQPTYAATGINSRACVGFASNQFLSVADHATLDHTTMDVFLICQRNTDSGGVQAACTKYGGATITR